MTTDLSIKSSALPVWDVADLQPVLETAFGNGGTFRDLLVALSSEGPCLISGAALREALDACQIRQALDEFLPYPQVVESLDEVYVTRSGDCPEIALHFAQPHALPQNTPFGTVTIHIGRTLTLILDERGDAMLKPGDMRVRWLGVTENLLVRLRRIEDPQGAQDVVQVSAGNILSQTTPLSVLTLRAAPIREIVAPVTPAPPPTEVVITVVHCLPGRVRLRVAGLYRNPAQKERIERRIARQPGIRAVSANILTGTVLIRCDPMIGVEEVQARVVRILASVDEPGQAQCIFKRHFRM